MKLTHTLLLAVATASLALASCSSEPSDWRPDDKVSLDMIAPGTRPTDNFDQNTPYAPNQAKGGAITKPISSAADLDQRPQPKVESTISANAEEGMRKRGQMNDAGKSGQADTAANGHEIQR
jgi:predicted component of type VI protein secretion system